MACHFMDANTGLRGILTSRDLVEIRCGGAFTTGTVVEAGDLHLEVDDFPDGLAYPGAEESSLIAGIVGQLLGAGAEARWLVVRCDSAPSDSLVGAEAVVCVSDVEHHGPLVATLVTEASSYPGTTVAFRLGAVLAVAGGRYVFLVMRNGSLSA